MPVLLPVLQDCCRLGRPDTRQGVQFGQAGSVEVQRNGPGWRRTGHSHGAECHVRPEQLEEPGPYPVYPIEASQIMEGTMRLPVGDDNLGQARTDLWQPGELNGRCPINVDQLSGLERTSLRFSAVPLSDRRTRGQAGKQLNLAWWFAGTIEEMANPLPGNGQCEKEKEGADFRGRHEGR